MRYVMTFKEAGENKGIADGMEIVGTTDKTTEDGIETIMKASEPMRFGVYQDDGGDWAVYRMYGRNGGVFFDGGIGDMGDVHLAYSSTKDGLYELERPGRNITIEFDKARLNAELKETVAGQVVHQAQYVFQELKVV